MIYAGTAAGRSKAHSKIDFKGKLYRVTVHAVDIPKIKLRLPTPSIRIRVLFMYRGSTVEKR
tara:strand:- start:989 stop:1174 length:186 start_codon:yes stop_codon:yes gene_type:complete